MFRYESEMIPVLIENLTKTFNTQYITTEFGTGNGVADLVFTTEMNEENLFLNSYDMMSLFVSLFQQKQILNSDLLYENCFDKMRLKKLLNCLKSENFICMDGNKIIQKRKYKSHTQNLFSIEAKLKDWKSGFYQALRYKFFSHKSYLAYPKQYIHRVDLNLLKESNIGLISVDFDSIEFVYKPKTEKPQDVTSYFFLSELFAKEILKNACA
ncbi:hypothetical protein JKA74_06005 [Marivirga sp. S37H4]|uniref:Uncharacterized protein n=1 Tax=Marivirga aurantiaca TaxID=2802615 RepID=A0A934WXD1_9BACT|nr:hypothetical protein [Marivirga aurantiaca]MBK6264586.1 hypothetical protein [Marivirga aurantiaca]